jgi:hypothetical protein
MDRPAGRCEALRALLWQGSAVETKWIEKINSILVFH